MSTLKSTSTSTLRILPHLPFEILTQILSLLPPASLAAARLTCTTWADVGTYHLHHRIYLAPRPHTLDVFTAICLHPIFSTTVEEIVYDDTLLEVEFTDRATNQVGCLQKARDEGMGLPSDKQMEESWRKYEGLFARQEELLEGEGGFESVIRECVRRLRRLRRVTVLGCTSAESRHCTRFPPAAFGMLTAGEDGPARPNLRWYFTAGPLSVDFAGTFPPWEWATKGDRIIDPSFGGDWYAVYKSIYDDKRGREIFFRVLKEEGRTVEVDCIWPDEVRMFLGR